MSYNPNIAYRADIDGLRAWAVGMVVVYHAGFSFVSGGFVGVDVFFVISGFLITNIILKEKSRGLFSLLRFYERRVRRIIPALAVMVLLVLLSAVLWILPLTLERISLSAFASLLFFANIHFWRQNDNYFAPGSETDPFLHTWSLAVEEQFYLVFPLLFLLLYLKGRRGIIMGFGAMALVSFVLMVVAFGIAPTATFFLPPTRAWEFLAGSLLAIGCIPPAVQRAPSNIMVWLGLALLVASGLLIESNMAFPGWITLIPVFGAVLIIQFGSDCTGFSRALLASGPIVFIGKISYSLYLWHWPIFVFAEHYWLYRELTPLESVLGILVSVGVAYLSYRFVEQPFRSHPYLRPTKRMLTVVLPIAVSAVIVAWTLDRGQGLPDRFAGFEDFAMSSQLSAEAPLRALSRSDCFVERLEGRTVAGCNLSPPTDLNTAILGDSFAAHYLEAMALAVPPEGRGLISFTSPQCPPVVGYDPVHLPACRVINERAIEELHQRDVDTVILAANWFNYILVNRLTFEDIQTTIDVLKSQGFKVVLLGQSPIFGFTSPEEAYFVLRDSDTGVGAASDGVPHVFRAKLYEVGRAADLHFDPAALLCDHDICNFHDGDRYLVRDYGHFTAYGAGLVISQLLQDMRDSVWDWNQDP